MANIYPFRALRYNTSLVRLEDVVTQPYDKISPALQQVYYRRSPYNLVRIILGLPELFDNETNNVYTRAARDFQSWREQGILAAEGEPAIFAYSQRYAVPGNGSVVRERRGFIALGELQEYSRGVVFRHEQTHSRAKSDRLRLLQETRAHFGQIFMLYSDPAHSADRILFSSGSPPDLSVTDDFGVLHRVWKITDDNTINIVAGAMQDKKLIIADGHHRYETALAYAREHAPSGAPQRKPGMYAEPAYPEAAVMMTFVNMDDEGITILPTHRVLHSLPGFSSAAFLNAAAQYFEISALTDTEADDPCSPLRTAGEKGTAFVAVSDAGMHLLRAREDVVNAALSAVPPRQRRLDLARLHALVIEKILGISAQSVEKQEHIRYVRDSADAIQQVRSGDANIAFLTNPVRLNDMREIAFAGEVMPQKSTDFYPKLLSGLTIYALEG